MCILKNKTPNIFFFQLIKLHKASGSEKEQMEVQKWKMMELMKIHKRAISGLLNKQEHILLAWNVY